MEHKSPTGNLNENGRRHGEWISYRVRKKSVISKSMYDNGFINGYKKFFDPKERLREVIFVDSNLIEDEGWIIGERIIIDYE